MKNKHTEFYQQFMETLNLSAGALDKSKDFGSDDSYSKSGSMSSKGIYMDNPRGLTKRDEPIRHQLDDEEEEVNVDSSNNSEDDGK
jgi:hypothetical protein